MQSKSKWPTVLIVVITLGLVFGPVFLPREISRWYLAAAHNAFRKKDSVLAEHYLKRAEAWDPSIVRDGDYWIAQVPKADSHDVGLQLDLLERAVMTDSRWQLEAYRAADKLSDELDFQNAVRALKIASLGQRPTTVIGLNQLAYTRAQAGIELEDALKDINRAISIAGPSPGFLDTKAWVLHGLGRNLEAWGWMNEAIKGMEIEFAKAKVPLPKPLASEPQRATPIKPDLKSNSKSDSIPVKASEPKLDQVNPTTATDGTEGDLDFLDRLDQPPPLMSLRERKEAIRLAKKRIGENGFILVIMRFHRLRILEALKQTELAAQDRRWLEERGAPILDELF